MNEKVFSLHLSERFLLLRCLQFCEASLHCWVVPPRVERCRIFFLMQQLGEILHRVRPPFGLSALVFQTVLVSPRRTRAHSRATIIVAVFTVALARVLSRLSHI